MGKKSLICIIIIFLVTNLSIPAFAEGSQVWTTFNGKKVMYDGNGNRVGYGESKKVIDVSSYNGTVDWAAVKNSGIDGAIIRATSYSTGSISEDTKFNTNVKGARNVGLPVGIYLYSYATNPTEALNEANKLVEILNTRGIRPSNLAYPVYYDLEGNSYTSGLTVSQYEQIVATFISRMEQAGFRTNIYSYTYYLNNNLNSSFIHRYVSWVAQYGKELTFKNNYYKGLYGWQYCSDGSVPGIAGSVDISCFSDFYGYDTENTTNAITSKGISEPTLEYRANSQGVEWLPYFTELNTAGTTGRNLDLYQLNLNLYNMPITARLTGTVLAGGQWLDYTNIGNDTAVGLPDKALQVVNFMLANVPGYKLYYRVHSSGVGWQDWTVQGQNAGIIGSDIEAIEFNLVKDNSVVTGPKLYYRSHVQNVGWQNYALDEELSGTTGNGLRLEALNIGIDNAQNYKINATAFIQNDGWKVFNNVTADTVIGSSGEGKELLALGLEVTNLPGYALEYQVHFSNIGWSSWTSNYQVLGYGEGCKIEAIRVRLIPAVAINSLVLNKNSTTIERGKSESLLSTFLPQNTTDIKTLTWSSSNPSVASVDSNGQVTANAIGNAIITATTINGKSASCTVNVIRPIPLAQYSTHVQNIGWQGYVGDSAISGTSGLSLRLEGIKINVANNDYAGGIEYQTHVQNDGWQDWKSNDDMAGTSGRSLRLEGINIRLTGELADNFDVYYKVHVQNYGWMDWVKNGELAGTTGQSLRLEAIQVTLVPKNGTPPF